MYRSRVYLQCLAIPCNEFEITSTIIFHYPKPLLTLSDVIKGKRMRMVTPVDKPDQNRAGLRLVHHVMAAVTSTGLFHVERRFGELQKITPAWKLIVNGTLGREVAVAVVHG